jgi:hypothetical protein
MNWLLKALLLLGLIVTSGCVTNKYQGWEEITMAHPKGFEDAVNGSYYRDGGNDSERFLNDLGRYINKLEYELERK